MIATKAVTPKAPKVFEQVTVAITFQSQDEVDMIHTFANELIDSEIDGHCYTYEVRNLLCNLTEHISEAITAD